MFDTFSFGTHLFFREVMLELEIIFEPDLLLLPRYKAKFMIIFKSDTRFQGSNPKSLLYILKVGERKKYKWLFTFFFSSV